MFIRQLTFIALSTTLLAGFSSSGRAQTTGESPQPLAAAVSQSSTQAPPDASALARATQLYRTGKLDSARQEYEAILQADPRAALAYVGLVRVYLRQKKPEEAYGAAAKAIELAPNSNAARVALGEVYFRQGKMSEAEAEFAAVSRAAIPEARAYLGLSRVYKATSHHRRAKVAVDRAYVLDPHDPDIQRAWIGTLSLQERLKALQAYLGGETNDNVEQRRYLEEQVVVLQDQAAASRSCRVKTTITGMETKLERLMTDPQHIRGFALGVKVNGVSSKLLLDTGAGGILVSSKIAEKAQIKPIVETNHKGIGDKGPAAGYIGYADSIKVGDLEFEDCHVEVIDKGSVLGGDGLIGADVFADFLIDIDFPNNKFRLTELPSRPVQPGAGASTAAASSGAVEFHDRYIASQMQSFTPVFRFGHMLLIQTRVNDASPKLFLIDTGAFNNTITPLAAREVTKVSSDPNLRVKGISGNVKDVFRADQLTLQFGHFRQKNVDIVAFDTKGISDSIGAEVSGLLGFGMLRMLQIKIDYRNGLVDFIFDATRWR
jgi:tetratricopeptide (TPR) repeat protein